LSSAARIAGTGARAIVVTTIAAPNAAMRSLASGAARAGMSFIVVGDSKSPASYSLEGCGYYDLAAQRASGFSVGAACPIGHYSRKNIGYLFAIRGGADVIVETDDDNHPTSAFFAPRERRVVCAHATQRGWLNVYRHFSDASIWPRGLPLDAIHERGQDYEALAQAEVDCPIQQGLADDNPDVDAIYRLTQSLPQRFRADRSIALAYGVACPFNSQNTTWWRDAFPLLYLPSHCSFRMTDIWRSFVAQRIAWENGWCVLFHGPTVQQERNEHDLMQDFAGEVPGYLHNRRIVETLEALELRPGRAHISHNLELCYRALVELGAVDHAELNLLRAWLSDLSTLGVI
jgi:hypothetical protein